MNIKPALCAEMDFDLGCYWHQPGWIVEEKKDGVRCLLHVGPESAATGRRVDDSGKFLPLADFRQPVTAGWDSRLTGCVFDGELMADGSFWIFDLPQFEGRDIRRQPLHERKHVLRSLADWLPDHARILPSFANVRDLGDFDEGFVWKSLAGKYSGVAWAKCKRTVTVDVEVAALREYGVAETKEHGKVRCVPESVKPGDVIECVAFGVWPSGCLKTGKFLRVRHDKSLPVLGAMLTTMGASASSR